MKKALMIGIPLILAAGLLAAAGFGFRGHHPGFGKDFLEYKLDRMSKELELTPAQQAQLDRIKQDIESRMDDRMGKRAEIHQLLKDELSRDNPNLDKIKPVIDKQIDEMAQFGHDMVNEVNEFYSQLTPEQKKKVSGHILDRMEEHERAFED
jgi:Spy/CpxP family protein refolding chaperone